MIKSKEYFDKHLLLTFLFIIQSLWMISYAIIYAILNIYMTTKLGMPPTTSVIVLALFISLAGALPLLGGWLLQKFEISLTLYITCNVMQIIACFFLLLAKKSLFFLSISLFLCGTITNIVIVNVLIGQFYNRKNSRDNAFFWNHSIANIAFFIGYYLCNFFMVNYHMSSLFAISALLTLLNLLLFLCLHKQFIHSVKNKVSPIKQIISCLMIFLLIWKSIQLYIFSQYILLILGLGLLIGIIIYSICSGKMRLLIFTWLLVMATAYWSLYDLTPSVLYLLIYHTRDLLQDTQIPTPQWLSGLNSLLVIFCSPIIGFCLYKKLPIVNFMQHTPRKFILAFLLMMLSICGFYLCAKAGLQHQHLLRFGLISYFIIQAFAEILIVPVSYSLVSEYISSSHRQLAAGFVMLPAFLGAIIAGFLAKNVLHRYGLVLSHYQKPASYYMVICTIIIILSIVVNWRVEKIYLYSTNE